MNKIIKIDKNKKYNFINYKFRITENKVIHLLSKRNKLRKKIAETTKIEFQHQKPLFL